MTALSPPATGSTASQWNCTASAPHPTGPSGLLPVRSPLRLPPSLPVVSRVIVQGMGGGAYKPWLLETSGGSDEGGESGDGASILMAYRAEPSKLLAFQRSTNNGAT